MTVLWTDALVLGPDGADTGLRALAVDRHWIVWIGADPIRAPRCERRISLGGRRISPGFVDGHAHLTITGLTMRGVDLSRTRSAGAVREEIARYCERERRGFVWGNGWDDAAPGWRGRGPVASDVDAAAGERHVYLTRVDAHSAVVSSKLFEDAGCVAHDGAETDDAGRFTGIVRREAHHAARRYALANVPAGVLAEAHESAGAAAVAAGITTVHEMAGPVHGAGERGLDILLGQSLPVDVVVYYASEDARIPLDRGLGTIGGDLNVDGALGSRTAALTKPYADARGHTGFLYRDAGDCAGFFEAATRAGLQGGVHCIGEAACEAAVVGLERAARRTSLVSVRRLRHRLEHFEMSSPELIERAARLGAAISMQPAFDAAWGGDRRMYAKRVGGRRARAMNHFRAVARSGGVLGFGSDSPVTPFDPLGGVRAAVRSSNPAHGVPFGDAFRAATLGAAALARQERIKGRLAAGYRADWVVWDGDPERKATVAATVLGGRVVHGAI
ncbi:MAG: amidohydrolase [Actinomycetota bacterium]